MRFAKNSLTLALASATLLISLAGAGCGKQAQSAAVVTPEVAPKVIETAFEGADAAVKAQAANAAEAARQQNPGALTELTEIMRRPDLTLEQRAALGRCLPSAIAAASAAARNGDKKAQDALQAYNAGK